MTYNERESEFTFANHNNKKLIRRWDCERELDIIYVLISVGRYWKQPQDAKSSNTAATRAFKVKGSEVKVTA